MMLSEFSYVYFLTFSLESNSGIGEGIGIDRSMEQKRGSRNSPHLYDQMIFYKGANILQWRKDNSFQ